MARRIAIVTAGHLATCPRMVKAADAMQAAGYDVRVISVQHTSWARAGDAAIRATRSWRWEPVECGREQAPFRWVASGAPFRAARVLAEVMGDEPPSPVAVRAFSRVHDLLVAALLREAADLVYGGTAGALAAAAEAGRRSGTPFAVDFEDFHCGEHDDHGAGGLQNRLAGQIMRDVLRDAAFVTAGSAAIAGACAERFGRPATPIHNVFPLPGNPPARRTAAGQPVRLYWFSQTIGPGRGLEDVMQAVGMLARPCELHLRGVPANGYVDDLRATAARVAPALRIDVHPPEPPDSMIDACRTFTIGLATEPGGTQNNALSLSNKALTYPLARLPVILTDTPGQRTLASDLGEGAVTYEPGDAEGLAAALYAWMTDSQALEKAADASWEAACSRWHWEHVQERDALLACVREAS